MDYNTLRRLYLALLNEDLRKRWITILVGTFLMTSALLYIISNSLSNKSESVVDDKVIPIAPISQSITNLQPHQNQAAKQNSAAVDTNHVPAITQHKNLAAPSPVFMVKSGDTLNTLLRHFNIKNDEMNKINNLPLLHFNPVKLVPGSSFKISTDHNNNLVFLQFINTKHETVTIKNENNTLSAEINNGLAIEKVRYVNFNILHSLYKTAIAHGVSAKTALEIGNLFNTTVDLAHQLRKDAHLQILYGAYYQNGKLVKSGDIYAAKLVNHNKKYEVIRNVDTNGEANYYFADGTNAKLSMMRTPLQYKYISSPFNLHRYQPILHVWRPHYGVDLAATYGTPIKSAGNGVITLIRNENGFGRVIKIRHNAKFTTVYAHMSRFANHLHIGSHVSKGEIIGFVGVSGLSTGPHLHYEVHINGRPVNPMTAALPNDHALPKIDRRKFNDFAYVIDTSYFD